MRNFHITKRFLTFNRIVGYATIAGIIATLYGVKKIYNLTVELKPVIEIIQKEQGQSQKFVRDTITIIYRDTVILKDTIILKDTVFQSLQKPTYPSTSKEWDWINQRENDFRKKHQLP